MNNVQTERDYDFTAEDATRSDQMGTVTKMTPSAEHLSIVPSHRKLTHSLFFNLLFFFFSLPFFWVRFLIWT